MSGHAGSLTTDPDRPLAWFRFDADFATDPRIGTLSDSAVALYILALCATARRITPCTDEAFAWWAHRRPSRIAEGKRQLIEAGFINAEWVPSDWHNRQPPTDATNAQRQARHREKLKASRHGAAETETDSSQFCRDSAAVEPRSCRDDAAERQSESTTAPQTQPETAETASSNAVTNALVTAAQDRTGLDRTEQTGQDRRGSRTTAATASSAAGTDAEQKSLFANGRDPFGPLSPEVHHERQGEGPRLRGHQRHRMQADPRRRIATDGRARNRTSRADHREAGRDVHSPTARPQALEPLRRAR